MKLAVLEGFFEESQQLASKLTTEMKPIWAPKYLGFRESSKIVSEAALKRSE
jgi:hypothetical protein